MEKHKPKQMGRPKMDNPANKQLPKVRVTQDKLDAYKQAAEGSGANFSQWVRGTLDAALVKTK
jgi:hypothetical protein